MLRRVEAHRFRAVAVDIEDRRVDAVHFQFCVGSRKKIIVNVQLPGVHEIPLKTLGTSGNHHHLNHYLNNSHVQR